MPVNKRVSFVKRNFLGRDRRGRPTEEILQIRKSKQKHPSKRQNRRDDSRELAAAAAAARAAAAALAAPAAPAQSTEKPLPLAAPAVPLRPSKQANRQKAVRGKRRKKNPLRVMIASALAVAIGSEESRTADSVAATRMPARLNLAAAMMQEPLEHEGGELMLGDGFSSASSTRSIPGHYGDTPRPWQTPSPRGIMG